MNGQPDGQPSLNKQGSKILTVRDAAVSIEGQLDVAIRPEGLDGWALSPQSTHSGFANGQAEPGRQNVADTEKFLADRSVPGSAGP